MLVSFSVENWRSFRDEAGISLVASRERQHIERLARVDKYQLRLLPVTAIYGGNASGKTNFFLALNFARNLVVRGTPVDAAIPVEPFRLDAASATRPSRFRFELLIRDTIYAFSFAVTSEAVLEEELVKVTSRNETLLYRRKKDKFELGERWKKEQFLRFAQRGTRDNQLFLTNAVSQGVELYRPVHDWFRDTLTLIAPDSRFGSFDQFIDEGSELHGAMHGLLAALDTGISRVEGERVSLDSLPLSEEDKSRLLEGIKPGRSLRLLDDLQNRKIVITRAEDGRLEARKLVAYHVGADGTEAKMEMWQESDGTLRVIDLLPALLALTNAEAERVFVVDEIGRSLHGLLIRHLLEAYLETCGSERRTQLLFTTHSLSLMDQTVLRRDEMWVTERDRDGSSTLYPFSDFKDVRKDKDLRRSYLQGRLGGIPRLAPMVAGPVGNAQTDTAG